MYAALAACWRALRTLPALVGFTGPSTQVVVLHDDAVVPQMPDHRRDVPLHVLDIVGNVRN